MHQQRLITVLIRRMKTHINYVVPMFFMHMYMCVHTLCISALFFGSVQFGIHGCMMKLTQKRRPALLPLSRDLVVDPIHTFSDFFNLVRECTLVSSGLVPSPLLDFSTLNAGVKDMTVCLRPWQYTKLSRWLPNILKRSASLTQKVAVVG